MHALARFARQLADGTGEACEAAARHRRHDFADGIPRPHKPTRDECEAGRRQQSAAAVLIRKLQPVGKRLSRHRQFVLKTVFPNHLGQAGLLSQSPLRERFLFLPDSPCRRVPQSPSPCREKEPDPYLPILATLPGAFGQGI